MVKKDGKDYNNEEKKNRELLEEKRKQGYDRAGRIMMQQKFILIKMMTITDKTKKE